MPPTLLLIGLGENALLPTYAASWTIETYFALSIVFTKVAKEVPLLIKNGSYAHPWLGIPGGKITPDIANAASLPSNYKGVIVGSVQPDSPADKAGVEGLTHDDNSATKIGDIIIALDGHYVRQIDDIITILNRKRMGR